MVAPVFTDEDLKALRRFPEIGREELFRFFTLPPADVAFIDPGRGRGPADRLGLAVALCTLPWLGFVPDDLASAPRAAVVRLAGQLQVNPDVIRSYGRRAKTRTDHLRLVTRLLRWRPAGELELKELDEFLLARAMEHDSPTLLFRLACEYLISARVIRPGPVTVVKRVAHAREKARQQTFDRLAHEFTGKRRAGLDGLLAVDPAIGMTRLRWLGKGPVEASAAAVKAEIAKLEFLRGMDAHTLDLSVLPTERQRFLATMGRRLTAQALQRREPERRYPILLTLLAQSATEVLDEVVQLFDQAISARASKAAHQMRDALAERAKSGEDCLYPRAMSSAGIFGSAVRSRYLPSRFSSAFAFAASVRGSPPGVTRRYRFSPGFVEITPRSSARLSLLSWSESLIASSSCVSILVLMAASRSAASGLKQMTNRSSSAIRTSLTFRFPATSL